MDSPLYHVYILHCADGTYYVGHAQDMAERLQRHNTGRGTPYTVGRRPLHLVFTEPHPTKASASRRERQLKSWSHAKKTALIHQDPKRLKHLSQSHDGSSSPHPGHPITTRRKSKRQKPAPDPHPRQRPALPATKNRNTTTNKPAKPMDPIDHIEACDQAWEDGRTTTDFAHLTAAGIALPRPDDVEDEQITAKLWEVINGLADLNTILYNTNHLSDRDLYSYLWHTALREEVPDVELHPASFTHLDILGRCTTDDIHNHLKYYSDERDRAFWAKDNPEDEIPDHEDPPYDRDRHLPGHEEWDEDGFSVD